MGSLTPDFRFGNFVGVLLSFTYSLSISYRTYTSDNLFHPILCSHASSRGGSLDTIPFLFNDG